MDHARQQSLPGASVRGAAGELPRRDAGHGAVHRSGRAPTAPRAYAAPLARPPRRLARREGSAGDERGLPRRFGRPRFLGKRPRHVLRLRYLRAVFPEAQFVHLVRDGRAVAASMLRRRRGARGEQAWWGLKPPGWRRVQERPPVVQCGWTWKRCCQIARDDAEATGLVPEQYHRVRYETLTARPAPTLNGLIEALGLSSPETFQRALRPHLSALENRNDRWPARLSATQQEALLNEIGEALEREGYGAG
ncbi:MAG: hypothetical protein BRD48_07350 [Bacteroidetes bacterium QS_9_68_14]|nr:MAG: hypothetical protein BRD48_07350 [Bacteroidetes bacterium QS_9_68_14]